MSLPLHVPIKTKDYSGGGLSHDQETSTIKLMAKAIYNKNVAVSALLRRGDVLRRW